MMKTILVLLMLSMLGTANAQPSNTTLIGAEGITITATTGVGVQYQFGAKGSYRTVAGLALPALVSCATNQPAACAALGGDPLPGVMKSIYGVQQTTGYTVTSTNGAGVAHTTWVLGNCALPAWVTPGAPVMPAIPPLCMAVMPQTAVATDGQMVGVLNTSAPVYFQYCQGTAARGTEVCDRPFMFATQPMVVGPNAAMGGPVGGTGTGTLYLLKTAFPVTVEVSPGPVKTVTIPAM